MQTADLVLRRACARFAAGLPCGERCQHGQAAGLRSVLAAAKPVCEKHGGFGTPPNTTWSANGAKRLYQVAPISSNLILSYVGEHILGMPRSY
jgi:hypothetical protein